MPDQPQGGTFEKDNQPTGEFMGHPRGLYVLFFTELWERFSFYGMKALLILYLTKYLIWTQESASEVMSWYAGLVYCTPVLGGILADKVFGARWSVVIGGVLMSIGHFLLAFEPMLFFFSGLGFLIAGCGMLKPNISTQVGALYRTDDERRDSAFTIFYMGINIGAFLGPLICGWMADVEGMGYHWGFAAAGVGMVLGLIIYIMGMKGVVKRTEAVARENTARDEKAGVVKAETPSNVIFDRIIVLVVICLFVVLFWMAFEQAANVMTVWADDHTNLYPFRAEAPQAVLDTSAEPVDEGFRVGAAQLQAVNPFWIIALGPVFASLWIWLGRRKKNPSTPYKMAIGVLFMMLAYGVMIWAAQRESTPSSAPLGTVPDGVELSEYGCTRLTFDEEAKTLEMSGVLTVLDRAKILAASAPEAFQVAVDELEKQAEEKSAEEGDWEVKVEVASVRYPDDLPDQVKWDAATGTLTASAELPERDKLRVLATAAPADFRGAVDAIFIDSSVYKVTVWWLILFYLLCTIGELCLSPVGLSLVTKLAPPKHVGLFMGLWFLTSGGLANWFAHQIGGEWGTMTPVYYFTIFAVIPLGALVLMLILAPKLKRMMHGVH